MVTEKPAPSAPLAPPVQPAPTENTPEQKNEDVKQPLLRLGSTIQLPTTDPLPEIETPLFYTGLEPDDDGFAEEPFKAHRPPSLNMELVSQPLLQNFPFPLATPFSNRGEEHFQPQFPLPSPFGFGATPRDKENSTLMNFNQTSPGNFFSPRIDSVRERRDFFMQ